jgi:hypothetical protein
MNAIYGSSSKEIFLKLQKLNSEKIKNNNSMLLINEHLFDIYKIHALSKSFRFPRKKYNTFLGVTENRTKIFNSENMNPLISNKWILCFIGEIKNINDIIEEDSEDVSVSMLQNNAVLSLLNYVEAQNQNNNDIQTLAGALSLIEGRYSMWLHNTENRNVYLMKCNDNLYADVYDNTFSTMHFKNSEPLNDGEIYQLTKEGITHVGYFDCSFLN